jgi:hypothetical protein
LGVKSFIVVVVVGDPMANAKRLDWGFEPFSLAGAPHSWTHAFLAVGVSTKAGSLEAFTEPRPGGALTNNKNAATCRALFTRCMLTSDVHQSWILESPSLLFLAFLSGKKEFHA